MVLAAPAYIAPPDVEPYLFGLIGATQEVPWDDHFGYFGAQWESMAEYNVNTYPAGQTENNGAGGTKTLDTPYGLNTAFPFAVYAGIACGSIGYTPQEFEDRTNRAFELAEQRGAESALWTGAGGMQPGLNNAAGTRDGITAVEATALNSGTATNLTDGLGLLEDWLALNYAGQGFIHGRRYMANLASKYRQVKYRQTDGALITPLGSRWIFGGGYDGTGPAAVAPATGNQWIYATGQVFISRGTLDMPALFEESIQRTTNELFMVVERPYLIGVDGPTAAVLINTTL